MKTFVPLLLAASLGACANLPPPPPRQVATAPYRALGTEPFWGLAIDDRNLTFTAPDAQPVVQPKPRVIVGFAGEIYQTPRINVNIVHASCSDGMSDRTYPDKVQVTVDGRRFSGCGGEAVAPTSLAGTNWRVESLNGRATPGGANYFMNFDANRLSAKFGCNSIAASYVQRVSVIEASGAASTRMACADMRFETEGGAILDAPMTISWSGGDRMTLSNVRGQIMLARSY